RISELLLQRDTDIVAHGQVREDGRDLERAYHSAAGDIGRPLACDVLSAIDDAAGSRFEKFRQQVEYRGLAGPGGADQRVYRPAADLEVHRLYCGKAAELLCQAAGLEDQIVQTKKPPSPTLLPGLAGERTVGAIVFIARATLIRACDGSNRRKDEESERSNRARFGRDQIRRRRSCAGNCTAARHRRGPDAGVDEPRCGPGEPCRGASRLLVALARETLAKRRNLQTGAVAARAPSRLRWRHRAAAGRPTGRRLPHRPAQLLLPRLAERPMGGNRGARGSAGDPSSRSPSWISGSTATAAAGPIRGAAPP